MHSIEVTDEIISELTITQHVTLKKYQPKLVTSLPSKQEGRQSLIIFTQSGIQLNHIVANYIHYIDDNNEMKKYRKNTGRTYGMTTDSDGNLFVFVLEETRYYLRKYKDPKLLSNEDPTDLSEDVSDFWSGCKRLVIRGDNIYTNAEGNSFDVIRLLEKPEKKLIDGDHKKTYKLPLDGEYDSDSFDVDSNGRMFVYCRSTHQLLYLELLYQTAEDKDDKKDNKMKLISLINVKNCGLTFDPERGYPCVINDKHVLLSVNSDETGNKRGGAVLSIRYNDHGFIDDKPCLVLVSTDSATCGIHKVCDSNTVVIRHQDEEQHSLRVYDINTVPATTVVIGITVPVPYQRGVAVPPPDDSENRYKMDHKRRGLAIIISNEKFDVWNWDRRGTEFDERALCAGFSELGFNVKQYRNKTAEEIVSIMDEVAKDDIHKESDAFVCAILSHGKDGKVYGTDGETRNIDDLLAPFKGDVCKALAGKPKLFFTQVPYRGRTGELRDSAVDGASGRIPTEADFLIACATVPGYVSWRNEERGSWFIKALCEVLKEHYTELDLVRILTRVNRKVAYEYETDIPNEPEMHKNKQMPQIASSLTKDLYFTPK